MEATFSTFGRWIFFCPEESKKLSLDLNFER